MNLWRDIIFGKGSKKDVTVDDLKNESEKISNEAEILKEQAELTEKIEKGKKEIEGYKNKIRQLKQQGSSKIFGIPAKYYLYAIIIIVIIYMFSK